jgi:hypothetical protein
MSRVIEFVGDAVSYIPLNEYHKIIVQVTIEIENCLSDGNSRLH